MSEANHTPGPWKHEGQGDITGIEDNGFGRGPVDVCSVYLRTVKGRHDANARLIAAAPDLLEALQELLRDVQDYQRINNLGGENNHSQVKAKAAIARAIGKKEQA